jgi:hypothetical protein
MYYLAQPYPKNTPTFYTLKTYHWWLTKKYISPVDVFDEWKIFLDNKRVYSIPKYDTSEEKTNTQPIVTTHDMQKE